MMPLMREKRISIGSLELALGLEASQFERLRLAPPYRYAVQPTLRLLGRLRTRSNGHPGPQVGAAHREIPVTPEARALLERVAAIEWYHTIDLPHGTVTPGFVDHRAQTALYGLPDNLRGQRALDVATYDGFWAFEMERRGAAVTAIDIETWGQIDFPRRIHEQIPPDDAAKKTGAGFYLAHELLGSTVRRELVSVYELSPERVGTFDIVFMSDLLLHLRDPQRALENLYTVTKPGGLVIIAEPYSEVLESIANLTVSQFLAFNDLQWWLASSATLKAMLRVAGFDPIEEINRFPLNCNRATGLPLPKVALRGHRPAGI